MRKYEMKYKEYVYYPARDQVVECVEFIENSDGPIDEIEILGLILSIITSEFDSRRMRFAF